VAPPRDPFDRLIVVQALGGYTLCTRGERLAEYGIVVLPA
jgi:PIN domain nuclease of toxin-antitoxin system